MLKIEKFACNMMRTNCYVVSDDTQECVIIDCGAQSVHERKAIIDYINENQLKAVHLLATHGHFDHNLGNQAIYEAFHLSPELHEEDERLYQDIPNHMEQFVGQSFGESLPAVGNYISENEAVSFGNHQFKVIETPGHTQGSVVYYCAEEQVAFAGDTIFKQSIGRTDLPGGSMFQMISSLRELAQLPDTTQIYPGHGPETTLGYELAHNPYMDR